MKKLHQFYIGGNAGRSNIEVHDIQFVVCEQFEDAIPTLKSLWFGDADKIHIDGWQVINWADGYDVTISDSPVSQTERLYFVNAGGYEKGNLAELHEFRLFVASNEEEAKEKGMAQLLVGFEQQHKDNLKDVDDVVEISAVEGGYILLTPNADGAPEAIGFQGYMPI